VAVGLLGAGMVASLAGPGGMRSSRATAEPRWSTSYRSCGSRAPAPIAGPLFPSSLLYFVSGVLEDHRDEPLVGMERY
jgi:hypothetical protein